MSVLTRSYIDRDRRDLACIIGIQYVQTCMVPVPKVPYCSTTAFARRRAVDLLMLVCEGYQVSSSSHLPVRCGLGASGNARITVCVYQAWGTKNLVPGDQQQQPGTWYLVVPVSILGSDREAATTTESCCVRYPRPRVATWAEAVCQCDDSSSTRTARSTYPPECSSNSRLRVSYSSSSTIRT